MHMFKKWVCLLLVVIMAISIVGCGKEDEVQDEIPTPKQTESKEDMSAFVGTWKGSDHDEENIIHYLICDQEGYWNVYMNYATLERAIEQRVEQYVSFHITFEGNPDKGQPPLNVSAHTGCYYEYVKYGEDALSIDKSGKVSLKSAKNVLFTKISKETGAPKELVVDVGKNLTVADQARDMFDRAKAAVKEQAD